MVLFFLVIQSQIGSFVTGCVSLGKFSAILTGRGPCLPPKKEVFGDEADYCAMTVEVDFLTGGHLPLCDFLSV